MPAQPTVAFGVDTDAVHLDSVNWNAFDKWTNVGFPSFAGRYFLGEPGTFLWGHGEGSEAASAITVASLISVMGTKGELASIAPIQAPCKYRQETPGELGYSYGKTDAWAICTKLSACITMGELALPAPTPTVFVYLCVERGTDLTTDYWAGWADSILAYYTRALISRFQPCIMCSFDWADGRYSPDAKVQACLNGSPTFRPGRQTLCFCFWATPIDSATDPTDLPPLPSLEEWKKFTPDPALGTSVVPVGLWRYLQHKAPLSGTEFKGWNDEVLADPDFAGGRLMGLDASNPKLGDFDPLSHMLTVTAAWRMRPGKAADVGNVSGWGIDVNVPLNANNLIDQIKALPIPQGKIAIVSDDDGKTYQYPVYAASDQHPTFVARYYKGWHIHTNKKTKKEKK